jgi:hypothetical protein
MLLRETIKAWGHPNLRSSHRTTLMVTKDAELTARGDCIVAVKADKSLRDLDPQLKKAMRDSEAGITLTIDAGNLSFEVSGRGDPRLTLSHPTDIVVRKSGYICDRTVMIKADKASCDIPPSMIKALQDTKQAIIIVISASL